MSTDDKLANCPLDRSTPYIIRNVSASQFSVSRYFGGMTYQDRHYIYDHHSDELVRADVRKWLADSGRAARRAAKQHAKNQQTQIDI